MESNDLQRCQSNRDGFDSSPRCIETLPVEIQRHIMLCLPSLGSLGAFIRASPVFHSLFQSEPKNYIANCLINILGDTFIDASTARAAMQESFQHRRCVAMKEGHETMIIWPFLEAYRDKMQLSRKLWIHSISLPEAVEMAKFQTSTVEPLVEEYASWALTNLGISKQAAELSRTERIRIQRAMYRFQIVCDVFGNKLKGDNLSNQRPRHLGCLRFLAGYEPWEIEEILCVNAFFQEQYEKRLLQVSEGLKSIVWRSLGEPGEAVDAMRARVLSISPLLNTCAGHTDTNDRHKSKLPQLPREPRLAASRVHFTRSGSRRARGHPARQRGLPHVAHVARRCHREHGHAREMGEVLFRTRLRPGRTAAHTLWWRRPGFTAAGLGSYLGRDLQQLVWHFYSEFTASLGLYYVGCKPPGGDWCERDPDA